MQTKMAKQAEMSTKAETLAGVETAPIEPEPVTESGRSETPYDQAEIARLAYEYWQARGCPDGSPEDDWFRAERELRRDINATK
jgi:hypothetical protein